ncbi:uncharacterized protein LOC113521890 [Galleria mellonella]|uniref:Uncharacterized protein LOC113521890 n=1 Tax=Galleria mellonella TaxID=7137 RepID=A0A6J3C1W2_GALME|nr:uncharacterized protein LOC113521890 [Galleria mellonella]
MTGRLQSPLSVDESMKSESGVLRDYYSDTDYLVSPSGVLKIASVVVSVTAAALFLGGGSCGAAPGLAASAPSVALAAAAAAALLCAGAALRVPLLAPQLWLYTDIIVSTVMGVLLLVSAILSMTLCDLARPLDYVHGPLSVGSACMVVGSAALTYGAVSRRLRRLQPAVEPPRPVLVEQDV